MKGVTNFTAQQLFYARTTRVVRAHCLVLEKVDRV